MVKIGENLPSSNRKMTLKMASWGTFRAIGTQQFIHSQTSDLSWTLLEVTPVGPTQGGRSRVVSCRAPQLTNSYKTIKNGLSAQKNPYTFWFDWIRLGLREPNLWAYRLTWGSHRWDPRWPLGVPWLSNRSKTFRNGFPSLENHIHFLTSEWNKN